MLLSLIFVTRRLHKISYLKACSLYFTFISSLMMTIQKPKYTLSQARTLQTHGASQLNIFLCFRLDLSPKLKPGI